MQTDRRSFLMAIGASASLAAAARSAEVSRDASDNAAAKKRALIVSGEDHPAHRWQLTTPVLTAQLEKEPRLALEVTEDRTSLRSASLRDFAVVVMHFKNYDPNVPGREGYDNLARFVNEGGGLVLVHFACGAFQEFKGDFVKLAGRVWNPELRGHDPYGAFRVEIVDAQHPITRGLESFETTDELYTCLAGETPIRILADAQSKVDGKRHPMAFVLSYGKGRVFHCLLGHDVAALSVASAGELLRRGTTWAAGLRN